MQKAQARIQKNQLSPRPMLQRLALRLRSNQQHPEIDQGENRNQTIHLERPENQKMKKLHYCFVHKAGDCANISCRKIAALVRLYHRASVRLVHIETKIRIYSTTKISDGQVIQAKRPAALLSELRKTKKDLIERKKAIERATGMHLIDRTWAMGYNEPLHVLYKLWDENDENMSCM